MRFVVGLGNPGAAYADTRHNVGFMVARELARRWQLPFAQSRHGMRVARGVIGGELVTVVEPQLYVNLSGAALTRSGFVVSVADLVVIHDDLDLDCGRVRVKCGGGTAGHRGLDSIVEHYGRDFIRVRVGIGRPPRGADAAEYVLSAFASQEREIIGAAIERAADAVECVLQHGMQVAMNHFNARSRGGLAAVTARTGRN